MDYSLLALPGDDVAPLVNQLLPDAIAGCQLARLALADLFLSQGEDFLAGLFRQQSATLSVDGDGSILLTEWDEEDYFAVHHVGWHKPTAERFQESLEQPWPADVWADIPF